MLIWRVLRVLAEHPLLPVDQVRRHLGASTWGIEYTMDALQAVGLIEQGRLGGAWFAGLTVRGERFAAYYLSGLSEHPPWAEGVLWSRLAGEMRPIASIELELTQKSGRALRQALAPRREEIIYFGPWGPFRVSPR